MNLNGRTPVGRANLDAIEQSIDPAKPPGYGPGKSIPYLQDCYRVIAHLLARVRELEHENLNGKDTTTK